MAVNDATRRIVDQETTAGSTPTWNTMASSDAVVASAAPETTVATARIVATMEIAATTSIAPALT